MSQFFISIFINHDATNTSNTDHLKICAEGRTFAITYCKDKLVLNTKEEVQTYLEDLFSLLLADRITFYSMDVIMSGYPSVKVAIADCKSILPYIQKALTLFA
jgi:hypothetical protein